MPEYAKKIEAWLEEEKEEDKEQKENQTQADKNESIKQAVPKLSLYTDENLPLMKLYRLESVLKSASDRRVWMKSGGYLVIEPTEALTVIDVNTGKYTGKKTPAETILKINWRRRMRCAPAFSAESFRYYYCGFYRYGIERRSGDADADARGRAFP